MPSSTARPIPDVGPPASKFSRRGPATAEALAAAGIAGAQIPETTFDSEGLLALPELSDVRGKRVLILRGDGGREYLGDALRARRAHVDAVACYRERSPGRTRAASPTHFATARSTS
jgi:uroporphyrinogen-III synthase